MHVAYISCGSEHSCALFANKRIYCWGSGRYGQHGQSNYDDIGNYLGSMTRYDYIVFSNNDDADMISAGTWHTYGAKLNLINDECVLIYVYMMERERERELDRDLDIMRDRARERESVCVRYIYI